MRNHTAKLNMMKMKKGDRGFFYHSNDGKEIVGIVEIIREHHPDPTDESGRALGRGRRQGGRAAAEAGDARRHQGRAEAQGHGAGEIQSRLSVQPVTAEEWKLVCKMGGVK